MEIYWYNFVTDVGRQCQGGACPTSLSDNHSFSSQWRHECDGDSNRRRLDGLLNRLFECRSKKTTKPCVTGLCEGNSPVTGEFRSQRASNAEKVSIWWRHHVLNQSITLIKQCISPCVPQLCFFCNICSFYLTLLIMLHWLQVHLQVMCSLHCGYRPPSPKIARFMGPTWGPPGSCRPQMGPMLAPWA